jgi:hypothetical protein
MAATPTGASKKRQTFIAMSPNVPVERRAAPTIAKLKDFPGASARTPGWGALVANQQNQ